MNEIFIERDNKLLRIAVRKDNKLEECFIEEENDKPYPGQIYKGIVKNIVPAIKCIFIDIGYRKNCYMYIDKRFNNTGLKKGDEIPVEVLKEEIGDKGPKVTSAISIPGRYIVLETLNHNITFSKNISDREFMDTVSNNLIKPDDVGAILRTNAVKVDFKLIKDEFDKLYEIYKTIMRDAAHFSKPGLLYSDEGILDRILRDMTEDKIKRIVLNNEKDYNYVREFIVNEFNTKINVEIYEGSRTLLDYYGIEKEILNLRNNKISLKCGGYIVIDSTEAMYVIDVNSGKNVKGDTMKKTALATNTQAAEEIARQVRLRNLAGIVVIDFIDVNDNEAKSKIIDALNNGFKDDKNKTVIYPFTELSLVQIARRRRGKSIYEYIEEPCSICNGNGKILKFTYLQLLIKNEIAKIQDNRYINDVYIQLTDIYKDRVFMDLDKFISEIDCKDKTVYINFNYNGIFKVSPLIFSSQIEKVKEYRVYG